MMAIPVAFRPTPADRLQIGNYLFEQNLCLKLFHLKLFPILFLFIYSFIIVMY